MYRDTHSQRLRSVLIIIQISNVIMAIYDLGVQRVRHGSSSALSALAAVVDPEKAKNSWCLMPKAAEGAEGNLCHRGLAFDGTLCLL
jgi:hypothetical protein